MKQTFEQRLEALEKAVFSNGPGPQNPVDDEGVRRVHFIWRLVCNYGQIPVAYMRIRLRSQKVAFMRQIAMALADKLSGLSQAQLATMFNRKNHTTIHHASKVVARRMAKDETLRAAINSLESEFQKAHSLEDTQGQSTAVSPEASHALKARALGIDP